MSTAEQNLSIPSLSITILSDQASWLVPWLRELTADWEQQGHRCRLVHQPDHIDKGDLCFILSCGQLVQHEILSRNDKNLVVHESCLPLGRGWSPLTWQILEGENEIVATMFEAQNDVDAGPIYNQEKMVFEGHELIDELRGVQARATLKLCSDFVENYPNSAQDPRPQIGDATYYSKRTSADSELDPNQTIANQFNLFRVADNERYPLFFYHRGCKYILRIEKVSDRQ